MWVLVLILVLDGQPISGQAVTSNTIEGFHTLKACQYTLDHARKAYEQQAGVTPEVSGRMFRRSFCLEKVTK